MGRSVMAYKRQHGAVSGIEKKPRARITCQFLIDTLPIRIALKSFDCIIGANSNRHSSEGRLGETLFMAATLETSLGRGKPQNSMGQCYNRSSVLRCEAK